MASTYSALKIELIGTGEQSGTWGNTTNTNLGTAIEEAITGSAEVPFSSADVTLTLSNSNASQTARNLRLRLTGTSGGARTLTVPDIEKFYIIANELADDVTVENSTGTNYTVPAGTTGQVFSTGAGIVDAISFFAGSLLSNAAVILGGAIENTPIGASTPSTIRSTNLTVDGNTILGNASGDTVQVQAAAWTLTNSPTVTGTWANLGSVTTVDINGGTIDGTTISTSRINIRASTTTSASSVTPDVASYDQYNFTALATGLTINAPTGTPLDGQKLIFRFLDNGTPQTLTWNATYTAIGVALPVITVANKTIYVGGVYNAYNTRWDVVAVATQP
jgi:hypothetical protein